MDQLVIDVRQDDREGYQHLQHLGLHVDTTIRTHEHEVGHESDSRLRNLLDLGSGNGSNRL